MNIETDGLVRPKIKRLFMVTQHLDFLVKPKNKSQHFQNLEEKSSFYGIISDFSM